jgi:hypothetical protein
MTSGVFARLLLRHPFQPLSFFITDHVHVQVERPEQVQHETGDRIAVVEQQDGSEYVIDLERVPMIEIKSKKQHGLLGFGVGESTQ